jgi:DNA topoisomerase-1
VLDAYLDGTMLEGLRALAEEQLVEELQDLQPEEAAVLAMLEKRLAAEIPEDARLQVKRRAA